MPPKKSKLKKAWTPSEIKKLTKSQLEALYKKQVKAPERLKEFHNFGKELMLSHVLSIMFPGENEQYQFQSMADSIVLSDSDDPSSSSSSDDEDDKNVDQSVSSSSSDEDENADESEDEDDDDDDHCGSDDSKEVVSEDHSIEVKRLFPLKAKSEQIQDYMQRLSKSVPIFSDCMTKNEHFWMYAMFPFKTPCLFGDIQIHVDQFAIWNIVVHSLRLWKTKLNDYHRLSEIEQMIPVWLKDIFESEHFLEKKPSSTTKLYHKYQTLPCVMAGLHLSPPVIKLTQDLPKIVEQLRLTIQHAETQDFPSYPFNESIPLTLVDCLNILIIFSLQLQISIQIDKQMMRNILSLDKEFQEWSQLIDRHKEVKKGTRRLYVGVECLDYSSVRIATCYKQLKENVTAKRNITTWFRVLTFVNQIRIFRAISEDGKLYKDSLLDRIRLHPFIATFYENVSKANELYTVLGSFSPFTSHDNMDKSTLRKSYTKQRNVFVQVAGALNEEAKNQPRPASAIRLSQGKLSFEQYCAYRMRNLFEGGGEEIGRLLTAWCVLAYSHVNKDENMKSFYQRIKKYITATKEESWKKKHISVEKWDAFLVPHITKYFNRRNTKAILEWYNTHLKQMAEPVRSRSVLHDVHDSHEEELHSNEAYDSEHLDEMYNRNVAPFENENDFL